MERILLSQLTVRLSRSLFTSTILHKNYMNRQGKMLAKIMYGSSNKKRFKVYSESPIMPRPSSLSKNTKGQGTSKRRVYVLNKLFMKYIADIMAMGSISNEVIGRGIEISRVKMNSDYNKVNVYWLAKGTDSDSDIEKILIGCAAQLRHELSQLRVMGQVPKIEFVKDKYYALVAEVDECLNRADFGEDFVPTDASRQLRSEFSLKMSLTDELKNKLSQLDNLIESDMPENPLPEMSTNVFGLDHGKIMKKVQSAVQQSNLAWEKSKSNIAFTNDNWMQSEDFINRNITKSAYQERKGQFAEFLLKRQIAKNKAMRKEKHASQRDREFILDDIRPKDEDYCVELLDDKDDDLEEIT